MEPSKPRFIKNSYSDPAKHKEILNVWFFPDVTESTNMQTWFHVDLSTLTLDGLELLITQKYLDVVPGTVDYLSDSRVLSPQANGSSTLKSLGVKAGSVIHVANQLKEIELPRGESRSIARQKGIVKIMFFAGVTRYASQTQFDVELSTLTLDGLELLVTLEYLDIIPGSVDLLFEEQDFSPHAKRSSTLASLGVRSGSVIHVMKKFNKPQTRKPRYSPEEILEVIKKLRAILRARSDSERETLKVLRKADGKIVKWISECKSTTGMAPDRTGAALLRNPQFIAGLKGREGLGSLVDSIWLQRPWLLNAFGFITEILTSHYEQVDAQKVSRQAQAQQPYSSSNSSPERSNFHRKPGPGSLTRGII